MKSRIEQDSGIELVEIDGQTIMHVSIPRSFLPDWLIGLVLLREELVERLTVSSRRSSASLDISMSRHDSTTAMASKDKVSLCLGSSHYGYLLHYLLRYYRDGLAEVDHIDIEASSGDRSMYVTISAESSWPPVDAAEARRRLGIEP